MLKNMLKLLVPVLFTAWTGAANASLIGDTVTVSNIFNGSVYDGPTDVLVGAGDELVDFGGIWTIDIGSESIGMTCTGSPCGNNVLLDGLDEYLFGDLDWVGMAGTITGVSFDAASTLTSGLLSFTSDSVKVSFAANTIDPPANAFVLINLDVAHVPAPATLTLFGLGLAGLGWSRRKKS